MPDTTTADLFEGLDVSFQARVSTLRKSRDLARRILEGLCSEHTQPDDDGSWWDGWQNRAQAILRELGEAHPLHAEVLGITQDEDFFGAEIRLERAVLAWLQAEERSHGA
jgi:hypothetical protein